MTTKRATKSKRHSTGAAKRRSLDGLVRMLHSTSDKMLKTGGAMCKWPRSHAIHEHGQELCRAAGIMVDWIDGIQRPKHTNS